jgi:hypothetical protein
MERKRAMEVADLAWHATPKSCGPPQGRVLANDQSRRPAGRCHREQATLGPLRFARRPAIKGVQAQMTQTDTVRWLTSCPASDVNFRGHLTAASDADLTAALADMEGKPGNLARIRAVRGERDFRRALLEGTIETLQALLEQLDRKPGNLDRKRRVREELTRQTTEQARSLSSIQAEVLQALHDHGPQDYASSLPSTIASLQQLGLVVHADGLTGLTAAGTCVAAARADRQATHST